MLQWGSRKRVVQSCHAAAIYLCMRFRDCTVGRSREVEFVQDYGGIIRFVSV